jgi:short-chain Z-isoprenyl diphosphate synthase
LLTWALRPLYRLYEERLARQIEGDPVPRHIGIILDGNRRHGERNGVSDPKAIYTLGAQKLDDVLDWCADLDVPAVTLWVFSTDNLDRPLEQVSGILAAIEAKVRTFKHDPIIHDRRVRVRAIGKLELLPPALRETIRAACEATSDYTGMTLTIAVAYGGRDEIVDAMRGLLSEHIERGLTLVEAIRGITNHPRRDLPTPLHGRIARPRSNH